MESVKGNRTFSAHLDGLDIPSILFWDDWYQNHLFHAALTVSKLLEIMFLDTLSSSFNIFEHKTIFLMSSLKLYCTTKLKVEMAEKYR